MYPAFEFSETAHRFVHRHKTGPGPGPWIWEKRILGKIEPQGLKMLSFFLSSMKDNVELIHFHVKSKGPFRANNV